MDKITDKIRYDILNCSKYYQMAQELEDKIISYLYENRLDLNNMLIDSCQIEHDPEGFINFLNGKRLGDACVDDFIMTEDEWKSYSDEY